MELRWRDGYSGKAAGFGTSITIGHVCQEILLLEKKIGAAKTPRKHEQPPGVEAKKKGKELSEKAKKHRRGAKSHLQQQVDYGSPGIRGMSSKVVPSSELTPAERQAWQKLSSELKESTEPIETDRQPPDSGRIEKDGRKQDRHRSSLRTSKGFASEPPVSQGQSSTVSGSPISRQSPPKGSLRIKRNDSRGKRRSLPVTPLKSPDKTNRLKEIYKQDLETLAQNMTDLNAIQVMSDAIQSADVDQLQAARIESRKQYGELSKRIVRAKKELKALESQRLVAAGTLKNLDELIASNPQATFPADTEWDVLGAAPEGSTSSSRSTAEHRRAQTDRL